MAQKSLITTATIGTVVVDCSISETHSLAAEATEHPVEQGADISDHVHVRPIQLSITGLVSNHPIQLPRSQAVGVTAEEKKFEWEVSSGGPGVVGAVVGLIGGLLGGNSKKADATGFSAKFNRVFDCYAELDRMLVAREVITISTALATYENMVIQTVDVNRTGETGDALPFTITAKQIRLVSTETVAAPPEPKDERGFGEASGGQKPAQPAPAKSQSLAKQALSALGF